MMCDGFGTCIPVPTGTDKWDDCRGLQYCMDGACTGCVDDEGCADGEYCKEGNCTIGCDGDDDCMVFAEDCQDSNCVEHECVQVAARNRESCGGGHCLDGTCLECLEDDHCPAGHFCFPKYYYCLEGCGNDLQCADQADACNTASCVGFECSKLPANEGADCPGGICVAGTCVTNS